MTIHISEKAENELDELPPELRTLFLNHTRKIASAPPQRPIGHGTQSLIEEVTRAARLIYRREGNETYILHFFRNQKEYERWYKSYK